MQCFAQILKWKCWVLNDNMMYHVHNFGWTGQMAVSLHFSYCTYTPLSSLTLTLHLHSTLHFRLHFHFKRVECNTLHSLHLHLHTFTYTPFLQPSGSRMGKTFNSCSINRDQNWSLFIIASDSLIEVLKKLFFFWNWNWKPFPIYHSHDDAVAQLFWSFSLFLPVDPPLSHPKCTETQSSSWLYQTIWDSTVYDSDCTGPVVSALVIWRSDTVTG